MKRELIALVFLLAPITSYAEEPDGSCTISGKYLIAMWDRP